MFDYEAYDGTLFETEEELVNYEWKYIKPYIVDNIYVFNVKALKNIYVDDTYTIRSLRKLLDDRNTTWLYIENPIPKDVIEILEEYFIFLPEKPDEYKRDEEVGHWYRPYCDWASLDELTDYYNGD